MGTDWMSVGSVEVMWAELKVWLWCRTGDGPRGGAKHVWVLQDFTFTPESKQKEEKFKKLMFDQSLLKLPHVTGHGDIKTIFTVQWYQILTNKINYKLWFNIVLHKLFSFIFQNQCFLSSFFWMETDSQMLKVCSSRFKIVQNSLVLSELHPQPQFVSFHMTFVDFVQHLDGNWLIETNVNKQHIYMLLFFTSDTLHQVGAGLPAEQWGRWAEAKVRTLLQSSSQTFIRSSAVQMSQVRLFLQVFAVYQHICHSVRLRPLHLLKNIISDTDHLCVTDQTNQIDLSESSLTTLHAAVWALLPFPTAVLLPVPLSVLTGFLFAGWAELSAAACCDVTTGLQQTASSDISAWGRNQHQPELRATSCLLPLSQTFHNKSCFSEPPREKLNSDGVNLLIFII